MAGFVALLGTGLFGARPAFLRRDAILPFDLVEEFAITPAAVKAGSEDVLEPGAAYDR